MSCKGSKILATCVTWTKKSSIVSISLKKYQNDARLKPHKMLTPIKKLRAYLIIALQCLIENCEAIYYMYVPMAGVGANIKKQVSKWMDLEVAITVVHTIKNIFNSIKVNQETVEKWILSQAVKELLGLFVSISKGMVPEVVQI